MKPPFALVLQKGVEGMLKVPEKLNGDFGALVGGGVCACRFHTFD